MVYSLIAMFDVAILLMLFVAIWMGKWGDDPKNMEVGEGASDENDGGATYMELSDGEDEQFFGTGMPDVPHNLDLYDEKIPEVSSDIEASQRHASKADYRNPSIDAFGPVPTLPSIVEDDHLGFSKRLKSG